MELLVNTTCFSPENRDLLARLQADHLLGLISNFDHLPTLYRILEMYDIRRFFDQVIVSVELGIRKPRKEIFVEALNRLNLEAHEVIYVGDNYQIDILGSLNAGLQAVWLNKKGEEPKEGGPAPAYIISDLSELLPIVYP